jgi:NAD(P)-dependent dehydrogenase (short-subunit alcohol dehydrogenase family)
MKNFLVIGASGGIGKEIASKLNHEGTVYTAQRSSTGADRAQVVDVKSDFQLDLPDELHGIVYCPGTINLKPVNRFKIDDFRDDFEINLVGAVKVIQQAIKPLKRAGNASIVLFSTVAVSQGMPFHASVASAKGAIEGLTRSLAAEFAPKIRVNAIAPSVTDTPLASGILSSDDRKEASAKRHPLQQFGTTEDVAELALYLITDKSKWMTGQIIGLDGGMSTVRGF